MKHTLALLAALLLVTAAGCTYRHTAGASGSDNNGNTGNQSGVSSASGWYYFSDTGIHAASNPSEIPAKAFKPWTEAVRVADAAVINGMPSLLINKLGIMTTGSNSESPALHTSTELFPSNTAGGIYKPENGTFVRLYRNSFFSGKNGKADENKTDSPCLARYEQDKGIFTSYLTASNFGLPKEAQCVALDRIGSMWYASFKNEHDGKVEFTYLEFAAIPEKKDDPGSVDLSGVQKISSDSYQKSVTPFSFKDAPEQLASILSDIPAGTGFSLKVYSPDGESAQSYVKAGEGTPVDGTAFVSDAKTAVLFADGTFYYRADNASGKAQVLHLPSLTRGYVYTSFILTGNRLLAAWEEQRFFETGRAGLLEITLPDAV